MRGAIVLCSLAGNFTVDGHPAIRLAPQTHLRDCRRPSYRVFRMGGDVLFDCELRVPADPVADQAPSTVRRII